MEAKDTPFSLKKTLNLGGKLLLVSNPLVMGILNMTPDSFYDGGRFNRLEAMNRKLQQLIQEGADIIDIGGYSTRPGAADISEKEEISRIMPAIEMSKSMAPGIPVSVDTFRVKVASEALDAGADMVNDVSGGSLHPEMFRLVADRQVPYILSHMRGNPQDMGSRTDYENLVTEIMKYFAEKLFRLRDLGVNDVVVDPGFGFAKTREQNYLLLRNLSYFTELQVPIIVGLSRKSMVYRALNTTADEALPGTIVLNTIALMNGASILRVHDVQAARQTISLFKKTYPADDRV